MGQKVVTKPGLLRLSVGMIFLTVFLLCLSTAYGGTISENFDNNSYNQEMFWTNTQGNGPSVAVADNRLEITIPGNSFSTDPYPFGGAISTIFQLVGDFDFQADFLINWSSPAGIQLGIGPAVRSGNFPAGVWLMSDPSYGSIPVYETWLNGDDLRADAPVTSGKLRLQRTGETVSTYYWNNGWQLLGLRTDPLYGANCNINLYALSHNFQGNTVQVAFDNIQIAYNKISFGGSPPIIGLLQLLLSN
jgi:hypothetical protein